MFYFIFAAFNLSDSHFCKKFMILTGKEHNKKIQTKTDTYKTKEI